MSPFWFLAVLGIAGPGEEEAAPASAGTEDVTQIDRSPLSKEELAKQEEPKLEAWVDRRVPAADVVVIAQGDSVYVPLSIPLPSMPPGGVEVRFLRSGFRGLSCATWLDGVTAESAPQETRRGSKRRRRAGKAGAKASRALVKGQYVLRASPQLRPGDYKMGGTVQIIDLTLGEQLAIHSFEQAVKVVSPEISEEEVRLGREAYLLFQGRAKAAHASLPELSERLRLDRSDPPPQISELKGDQVESLVRFFWSRLKADIARERLRAAADSPEPRLAEIAVLALGSLSRKPEGPAARALVMEGRSAAENINLAAKLLSELSIDEAEGVVSKLRRGGGVGRDGLARVLALHGAIAAIRGRPQEARKLMGQALCAKPGIEAPMRRPPVLGIFESVQSEARCQRRVGGEEISAERSAGDSGAVLVVQARFGPDPYQLIAGGEIRLFGGGGKVITSQSVRAEHDGAAILRATFQETDEIKTFGGELLTQVIAQDVSGVPVASFGDPDPVITAISSAPDYSEELLPIWVWIAAGVVAVAGATTALVVVAGSGDSTVGIGPIGVSF